MKDILDVKKRSSNIRNDELYSNYDPNEKNLIKSQQDNIKRKNRVISSLSIATAILALSTIGFGIGFGISQGYLTQYQNNLEGVYKSNFYSMLDSVNNLENKISKTIASNSSNYQRKTLLEASKNASEAEISVASLPLSQNDIQDTVKMVNQISGYTSTLAEDMVNGRDLTQDEIETLQKIDQSLIQLKLQLNDFARKLNNGFSITNSCLVLENDTNDLSKTLSITNNDNIEYPTMIYDGPFSDSVVNSTIKGLSGDIVSKSQVMEKLQKVFKDSIDIVYESETKGKFETYNFRIKTSNEEILYVQATKIGGHILTISGAGQNGESYIDYASAKEVALNFAKDNGIENGEVVWTDTIDNDIYFNIAPTLNNIVLYPDLVKVKVNNVSGTIVGYDATSYFTNHTDRGLSKGSFSISEAVSKIQSGFEVKNKRYVLTPLDYNREVVCIEIEALKYDNTYYFYYNCLNGKLENVLKVIKTDNGNLLQ